MAYGGGNFVTQNKVLPGAYINFISTASQGLNMSERGYVAMGVELDFGVENKIFEITSLENCLNDFGYEYTDDKLKGLRDLFKNASTVYFYRLNSGGTKASNDYATCKYCGTRGNDIRLVINVNIDDVSKFDVETYLDSTLVDTQTVSTSAELIDTNFVSFKTSATLEATAGIALTGGANGTVTSSSHQKFLDLAESYAFNVLATTSDDDLIKALYTSYTKRMRDEVGSKFQLVVHNYKADYEGVVSVTNECLESKTDLIYWVSGALASCLVQKSVLNKTYDGEFTVNADYTQTQLSNAIQNGEFILHKVGSDVKVLSDINTLLSTTTEKGDIFKKNQTIRVVDQIATDIATLFNTKYLGIMPNDNSGRISLWNDICTLIKALETVRAVENFSTENVQVTKGDSNSAVLCQITDLNVVNAMEQLYMNVMLA